MNKSEIRNLMKEVLPRITKDLQRGIIGSWDERNLTASLYFHLRDKLKDELNKNKLRIILEYPIKDYMYKTEKDNPTTRKIDLVVKKMDKSYDIEGYPIDEKGKILFGIECKHSKSFNRNETWDGIKGDYRMLQLLKDKRNYAKTKLGYCLYSGYYNNYDNFREELENPGVTNELRSNSKYKNYYHEAWIVYCKNEKEKHEFGYGIDENRLGTIPKNII